MKFSIPDVEEFMLPQKDVSGQVAKVKIFLNFSGMWSMYFDFK
jgi:hypothetical protein